VIIVIVTGRHGIYHLGWGQSRHAIGHQKNTSGIIGLVVLISSLFLMQVVGKLFVSTIY